jgi:mono/diheme cytochrome c family protein
MALAILLTVGLLAFTLVNWNQFVDGEMLGCGTVALADDVVFPEYYNSPLEHSGLVLFEKNCKTCHRLDQKLVGSALRNSFETRDSIWFVRMIVSARGLVTDGDTLAKRLFEDYDQTLHPDFKAFSKKELGDLVEYLKLEGMRDNGE